MEYILLYVLPLATSLSSVVSVVTHVQSRFSIVREGRDRARMPAVRHTYGHACYMHVLNLYIDTLLMGKICYLVSG